MLVAVTGFGSVWRHRLGKKDERGRFAQPVYYNTTGVPVKGKIRQRPEICGYARFDRVGGFDPNHLSRMMDRVFECAEPSVWMGYNKLLFRRILKNGDAARPDCSLVITSSDFMGQLAVGSEDWRSNDTWLLSFSESKGAQEAMLLMPIGGWIRTTLGRFVLACCEPRQRRARLLLSSEE